MRSMASMALTPKITVAVCTRNHAAELGRLLPSLSKMQKPAGLDWELLVIDNGSTDGTQQVLAEFAEDLPLRVVVEAKAGLSQARNAAVAAARGDYIVWTDDDTTVDEQWLLAYLRAILEHPQVAIFGGAIEPVLVEPTPHWFTQARMQLAAVLVACNPSDYPADISKDDRQLPMGANFAVRTNELRRFSFDVNLGKAPGRERGGEETKVLAAILTEGAKGRWVPDARVSHWIPASRQTLPYVSKFYQAAGDLIAYQSDVGAGGALVLGGSLVKGPVHYICYMLTRFVCAPPVWLHFYKMFSAHVGVVRYFLSREKGARPA